MTSDDRHTPGLILDVLDVLERHGYHRYDNRHTGQAIGASIDLAYVYDGTLDTSYRTYLDHAPPGPHTGPGPSDPDADDAVILTGAEVSTVVAALNMAADYKMRPRRRLRGPGLSDLQFRLSDAKTYNQMAARMLQTAAVARTANSAQPEPGGPPVSPRQPHPADDKEAGQ